jgi:hypothetical protein
VKQIAALIIVIVAVCAAEGRAASSQVILNGGFESGVLAPWFPARANPGGTPDPWSVTSSSPHTGTYAATSVGNLELRQNFAAIPTGEIQEVSFWLRHELAHVKTSAYTFFYSDNSEHELYAETTTANYEKFTVTSLLTPGKQLVGFSVYGNTDGRTFLDDVRIVVPEPPSLILAAVIAVAIRRRRFLRV